ncbi:ATP phosphoribosyltransferase regulatory subunit [Stakelama saccharophila]|uniref:ATP phosphoribosyltransferase regulatory subunit n=1 Tax=Stakelama saccharophila TaxID=3075605 RepID=A0ABZ0BCC8_9SPHN|nr:ATP phosphoribosyltransferase regulatory subunit [Stakelama sp. W311]WNO53949.1 ATP phosphoribosyltransferase regulatory subunit [Stakelama sp. W311]
MTSGLLPQGFHDRLPPHADAAAALEARVLATAHAHGYERVDPPLAEFEDSLASRLKSGSAHDAVRFVDPVSQRTLAIRTDMTAQIGRIAATRMGHHPRPVRLSYAGPVVKLRAPQLHPERAMRQIGVELIGSDGVAAAKEIVAVAVEALQAAGVDGLSIDFTLPDLVDTLADGRLSRERLSALRQRLDAKDAAGVAAIDPAYLPLVAAAGPFDEALAGLRAYGSAALASRLDGMARIADRVRGSVAMTLDPTELHGFEYQSWFGFSLFAAGSRDAVGRGGSYTIVHGDGREEAAVGFSLYADAVLVGRAGGEGRKRLFLPLGTDPDHAAALRRDGWVTVAALDDADTPQAQLCTHRLAPEGPVAA